MEKILLLPKALDLDRPKRSRTAFAKWQLDALETHFGTNPYLIGEQRTQLAKRLGLSETQVTNHTSIIQLLNDVIMNEWINQSIKRLKSGTRTDGRNSAKKVTSAAAAAAAYLHHNHQQTISSSSIRRHLPAIPAKWWWTPWRHRSSSNAPISLTAIIITSVSFLSTTTTITSIPLELLNCIHCCTSPPPSLFLKQ